MSQLVALAIVVLLFDIGICLWATKAETLRSVTLGVIILPIILYLTCRFPEIMYVMFLTAGAFKADPRLRSLLPETVDLTVVFALLAVIGIIYNLLISRWPVLLPPRLLLLPYSAFTMWAAYSLSFTDAPLYGTDKLLRFVGITSLALYLPFWLPRRVAVIRRLFATFVFVAVAMLLDVFRTGVKPATFELRGAFGGDYLQLGSVVGMALLIAMFFYLMSQRRLLPFLFHIALSTTLATGMFLGGGRGPLLGAAVTVGVILLDLCVSIVSDLGIAQSKDRQRHLSRMAITILMTTGLTVIAVGSYSSYFTSTWDRLDVLVSSDGGYSVAERARRYREAENIATNWLTGVTGLGIGGFTTAYGGYDAKRGSYPHNIFLEIASELGAIGLIAFLWLLLWTILRWLAFRQLATLDELGTVYSLLALLVFQLFNACVSGDINDNRLLFAAMGLISAFSRNYGVEELKERSVIAVRTIMNPILNCGEQLDARAPVLEYRQ